ncbi:MAG: type II/IV secretion system protein [Burkholderiaceae bacterium]|nr:type II/IV secretion system protein [Burkholderiaceae bacterium]
MRDANVLSPHGPAEFARIAAAAREARTSFGVAAGDALHCDAYEALRVCAQSLQMPYFDSERLQTLSPAFDSVSFPEADRRNVVIGRDGDGRLWCVTDDPFDTPRTDWAEGRIGVPFSIALAVLDEIRAYLKRHETTLRAVESVLPDVVGSTAAGNSGVADELSISRIAEDASPVVRLVNSMLYDALKAAASDVHLETDAAGTTIKYRVDGVLDAAGHIDDPATSEQVISRIKVLAELDIAEKRVPQDGRFQVRIDGRDIDLRVSIMPAVHGEDAVVRILDRKRLTDEARGLRFESLGFDGSTIAKLRMLSRLPYGLLLVTGPTGSGKTTTLYAALSEVNSGLDKIVTIEDPVEYQLAGVVQIPVNERRGLTFSKGLRSILRHDPDKIMVGEIRDGETAQIAVQAALTGHLVFTTVHANSVFDVIGRMLHIGVDPFNLVSALNGVVAQRLLRVNCAHCLAADAPDLADRVPADREALAGKSLMRGRGCGHCRGTGYRGRRAIAEILAFDDDLREALAARASAAAMRRLARARGMRTMRQVGLDLVASGVTTLAELDRVSFSEGPVDA